MLGRITTIANTKFTGPVWSTNGFQTGSTVTSALIIGAGTATTPYSMGTTALNLIGLWGTTAAVSGSSRAIYARLYFTAAGDGEAVRAYGTVNNATVAVGGTVNGLHASLSATGASAAISGAGHAIRATLDLGASTAVGGTLSVLHLDTVLDTAATVPASTAFIGLDNVGVKKINYLMRSTNTSTTLYATAGTGSGSAGNSTHCAAQKVMLISIDGADVYIPVFTQNS